MRPPGAFKIAHRRYPRSAAPSPATAEAAGHNGDLPTEIEARVDPLLGGEGRCQRILESLRSEIIEGGGGRNLRIRRVFETPREIYRLELELPELGYQRTTLLDREALEELLEADDVRAVVSAAAAGW